MTAKQLYFVMIGAICLLFLALIGGAINANKMLGNSASHLTNLKAKSAALTQEQATLKKSKEDIKKYAELQKITQTLVPEDKSQAEAVREIVNIAAANGVSLSAINFPASTLGSTTALASAAAPAAAATTTTTPAANSKAGALSQLVSVKTIPGVYQLTITVESSSTSPVRYDKFINFLSGLEHNRRTAQVSTISLEPDKTDRNLLSFTLTLNEYIKP